MAFPTSPTNGQTTTQNGQVYTYSSSLGAWTLTAASTGALSYSDITASGNVVGDNLLAGGILSSVGNVTGGNLLTAGNVTGGNLLTAGAISATGNINGGNLVITGVLVDNIGNLELQSTAANGNINLTPSGTGIVGISSALSVTGSITGASFTVGNVSVGTGNISTTGNVSAGNVIAASFSDSTGIYNVNLGGASARGAAAGYSGGAYGGIGYNIQHTASAAVYNKPLADQTSYLRFDNGGFNFLSNSGTVAGSSITMTSRMLIDNAGMVTPGATGTQDLGSSSLRWRNVYTSDLHLNNGIGNYTIVEGEDDLFLYNNKNGKTYKFALTEVDPSTVPPKMKED